jgi:hypothetical protein
MPKYRQLHTKIIDSFDFTAMPNDFTRVMWLLMIVIVDSKGRGIDNMAWVRSKMFPLRDNVTLDELEQTMTWLATREMIIRYKVQDRSYFSIIKFLDYQTGTEKEAPSVLPPPPEKVGSKSVVSPEEVKADCIDVDIDIDLAGELRPEKSGITLLSDRFTKVTNIMAYKLDEWNAACTEMFNAKVTPDTLEKVIHDMKSPPSGGKTLTVTTPKSCVKLAIAAQANGGSNQVHRVIGTYRDGTPLYEGE